MLLLQFYFFIDPGSSFGVFESERKVLARFLNVTRSSARSLEKSEDPFAVLDTLESIDIGNVFSISLIGIEQIVTGPAVVSAGYLVSQVMDVGQACVQAQSSCRRKCVSSIASPSCTVSDDISTV